MIRLNKFLTQINYCSRREADRLIEAGRVFINDKKAILGDKIDSEKDQIFIDKKPVNQKSTEKIYLAFNKPIGVICTTDEKSPNNIIDALHYPQRVYPVGRLDVNSSGLILLTNDGEFVNKILLKEKNIEKEYEVAVDKTITERFISQMQKSFYIDRAKTLPAKVEKIGDKSLRVTIQEGKKRQVRRMCEKCGYNVTQLKRTGVGKLKLGSLNYGQYKKISPSDVI